MAKDGFARAYARVRVYEGGNVDDPRDPGGRTSRGVTQRVYDGWCRRNGVPKGDVWKATAEQVAAIYRTQYWDRIAGDELPPGVDFAVFDAAVNSGVGQAGRWLQRSLRAYTGQVDGQVAGATLKAVDEEADDDALVARICAARLGTLRGLRTYKVYGKGWSARVANVQKIGQAWASGSVGPQPVAVAALDGHRKAIVADETMARPFLSTTVAAAGTTASGAASSLASFAADANQQLTAYQGLFDWAPKTLAYLTAAGAAATLLAKYGHAVADKAQAGLRPKPVDLTADEAGVPVAVNDDDPEASAPPVVPPAVTAPAVAAE